MTATLIQRRRGTRIRAQIPLRLTSLDPACRLSENCHTLLVNPNGCGVRLNRPLKPGLRLRIDGLPGAAGSAAASVTANVPPRPGSRYWTVGLGFDSPGNLWCLAPAPPDWSAHVSEPFLATSRPTPPVDEDRQQGQNKQLQKAGSNPTQPADPTSPRIGHSAMVKNRRFGSGKFAVWLLMAFASLMASRAFATLGEDVSSIKSDQVHLEASVRVLPKPLYSVDEMQTSSGTTIQQFVSSDGRVFAVSWRGSAPNLRQLLGSYFDEYIRAADAQPAPRGRAVHIESGDLVVDAGGHMRFHVGRAFLKSRLPQGVSADEIH